MNTSDAPWDLTVADVNGDGREDITVAGGIGVDIFRNEGAGDLGDGGGASMTSPRCVAVGDLDNDLRLDVVTARHAQRLISRRLQRANGSFATGRPYSGNYNPIELAIADLNVDGYMDIVVAHNDGEAIVVYLGSPVGELLGDYRVMIEGDSTAVASADCSKDDYDDLVNGPFNDGLATLRSLDVVLGTHVHGSSFVELGGEYF